MLIGLHGFAESGKDTVYSRIRHLGRQAVRVAFADKLKVSAMRSLGFRQAEDSDLIALANQLKDIGVITIDIPGVLTHVITGRQYLQYFGTEGHRDVFSEDFWVDQALLPVMGSDLDHGNMTVVATDCRFVNEAERIRQLGGEVWEVKGLMSASSDDHPSEVRLPDHLIDLTIDNTVHDDEFAHLDAEITRALGVRQT